MSKSKIIIGIVLIVVGGGLVPTGFFVNQMFVDQIADGVPDALLAIEAEALPSLEDQLPPLGTPNVLLGVEDAALTSLESQLPVLTTPVVLDGLKEEAVAALPAIINGSGAAIAINQTIDGIAGYIGYPAAKEQFFNSPSFQADFGYVTPQGVSDYYDTIMGDFDMVNLGYTVTAQNNLLYGVGPLPGLITDLDLGMGLLGYMQIYVEVVLGDQSLNATMQSLYNATWTQLEYLAGYINNYLWDVVVKYEYSSLGYTIEQYAELVFYSQWANGTIVDDGIDLSLFKDTLPADTKGLEAGIPNPTNITIPTCIDLWDVSNPLSFVNDSGILVWVGAMQGNATLQGYLIGAFSLNGAQLTILLGWLGNFLTNLVPLLLFDETGYTVPELAQLAFYEQWANGTIQGAAILPDGFLNELSSSFAGAPYFEVGLPSASGLSLVETMNLWNEANAYAFVNMDGILVWLGALSNTTLQSLLISTFGISAGELTMLLTWLGSFLTVRVPQLIEYETGYTVPELAQISFYEQWANGTIQGLSILPDGFLSQRDPPILGPPYFEVSLTTGSTGLTVSQCDALWNEASEYSLVSASGINKWYKASSSTTTYEDLRTQNGGLSPMQMTHILVWLTPFRDEIVNTLAKEELSLPMEPYALGNALLIGLGAGGGTLAALGIIVLILSRRK